MSTPERQAQALRFLLSNALCFALDCLLLMLGAGPAGLDEPVAAATGFAVATVANYALTVRWVYRGKQGDAPAGDFAAFVAMSSVGLLITTVGMWVGTSVGGGSPRVVLATKLCVGALSCTWNYLSRRQWYELGGRQRAYARVDLARERRRRAMAAGAPEGAGRPEGAEAAKPHVDGARRAAQARRPRVTQGRDGITVTLRDAGGREGACRGPRRD